MDKAAMIDPSPAETAAITLTEAAVVRVRLLMERKGGQASSLRIGVRGGGCSGLSYYLELVDAPRAGDTVLEIGGLTVVVDPKSLKHITGLVLDYSTQNLLEGGWKFSNPNAARSCGCGTSFTPAAR